MHGRMVHQSLQSHSHIHSNPATSGHEGLERPRVGTAETLTLQPWLFGKKQGKPRKKQLFFSSRNGPPAGTPKILEKERKNAQKSKGNRKTKKSKEIEKSKDWRVRELYFPKIAFEDAYGPSYGCRSFKGQHKIRGNKTERF